MIDNLELLDRHLEAISHVGAGWGTDPYHLVARQHPMACALYLSGLCTLAGITRSSMHLAARDAVLEDLLRLRRVGGGWGLGFPHRDRPADTSYAITTGLAGQALLEYYAATHDPGIRQCVSEAAEWLTQRLPWSFRAGGAGPWYAPGIDDVLPNVASVVGGFLYEAHAALGDERLLPPARSAIGLVLAARDPSGAWRYGGAALRTGAGMRNVDIVDLLHMAYVLDGLIRSDRRHPERDALREAVHDGVAFVRRWLVRHDGFCFEKVLPVDEADPVNDSLLTNRRLEKHDLDEGRYLLRFPAESRLWGYGAVIGMASRAAARVVPGAREILDPTLARVLATHVDVQTGRFRYLAQDPHSYPRHEAHLFEGLCSALASHHYSSGSDTGSVTVR